VITAGEEHNEAKVILAVEAERRDAGLIAKAADGHVVNGDVLMN